MQTGHKVKKSFRYCLKKWRVYGCTWKTAIIRKWKNRKWKCLPCMKAGTKRNVWSRCHLSVRPLSYLSGDIAENKRLWCAKKSNPCNPFSLPVIHEEKIWGECVQIRRYQICVFCISIPLRVCQRKRRTRRKAFLRNYGKQKKCQRTFVTNLSYHSPWQRILVLVL